MADCTIIIVGCNHGVQARDEDAFLGDTDEVKEHKSQFRKLIDDLIKENGLQFIGEEWGLESVTLARLIADNAKLHWENFNTTNEDLDSAEQKERWTRQREPVMLGKLLEHKGDAEQFLVICGFGLMKQPAEMLRKTCQSVKMVDCRTLEWYNDQLFAD